MRTLGRERTVPGRTVARAAHLYALTMPTKYFTHFVAGNDEPRGASEWSGVVEVSEAIDVRNGVSNELRMRLAESFDLESEEIRILQWARLH